MQDCHLHGNDVICVENVIIYRQFTLIEGEKRLIGLLLHVCTVYKISVRKQIINKLRPTSMIIIINY